MFRVLLVFTVPAACGIIVKDPPLIWDEYSSTLYGGDVVSGAYSLLDPDSTRRIFEYTAEPRDGFQAVVTKETPSPLAPEHPPPSSLPQLHIPITYYNDALYRQLQTYFNALPDLQDHHINNNVKNVEVAESLAFFTPANKIMPDMPYFGPGQYFEPNNK